MNQLNVITSTVATATAWLQGGGSESVNRHQHPKEWRRVEPTWLPLTAKHRVYFMWCYVWRFFGSVGRTFTTMTRNCWAASRTEERSECTASEEEESQGERERTEQEQSYAVILMVCAAVCLGLVDLAPSGSVLVVLRLRVPSVEPTLEAEWVLERTSRVIPAVGTGGRQRHESGVSNRTDQHGAASCVSFTDVTVQPARADLNRPHCDRAAGFKSDDSESEAPFTLRLQTFSVQRENSKSCWVLQDWNKKTPQTEAPNLNYDVTHNDEKATNWDLTLQDVKSEILGLFHFWNSTTHNPLNSRILSWNYILYEGGSSKSKTQNLNATANLQKHLSIN